MRRALLVLPLLSMLVLLTACVRGDGVRERVFPPTASIQELALKPDGQWVLKLRLQNFSNVAMRFDAIEARLRIGTADAGAVKLQPMLSVPPESAEIVEYALMPAPGATADVRTAATGRGSVRYALEGTIRSTEPDSRTDEFLFESQLSAVPGLAGVLR